MKTRKQFDRAARWSGRLLSWLLDVDLDNAADAKSPEELYVRSVCAFMEQRNREYFGPRPDQAPDEEEVISTPSV